MAQVGQAAARAAIAAWFSPQNVAGLGWTYRSTPNRVPGVNYKQSQNNGSGAVLIVHLPGAKEVRIAMGGPTSGEKFAKYSVALEIRYKSVKTSAMNAQDDLDTLIDTLLARIRADRTFGTTPLTYSGKTSTIWQAGEGAAGIEWGQLKAVLNNGVVEIPAWIKFECWIYIAG